MPRRNRRPPPTQPRSNRESAPVATPLGAPKGWTAHRYQAREAGPDYVCPRCHRPVVRTTEHVVAWTEEEGSQHRHWHGACWTSAVREGIDRYRWG